MCSTNLFVFNIASMKKKIDFINITTHVSKTRKVYFLSKDKTRLFHW